MFRVEMLTEELLLLDWARKGPLRGLVGASESYIWLDASMPVQSATFTELDARDTSRPT